VPRGTALRRPLVVLGVVIACAAAIALAAYAGSGSSTGSSAAPGYVRVSGHVVDAYGRPVAGAVVRDSGVERRTRSSRSGAFSIVVPTGRRTLVAARSGYVPDTQTLSLRAARGTTFTLWQPGAAAPPVANAASRIVFWADCRAVVRASDAQLAQWKRLGMSGLVCSLGHLKGLGGTYDFSGTSRAPSGAGFAFQRKLAGSRVIDRLHRLGIDAYLGFYATNASNSATPFAPWFDDRAWNSTVLPAVQHAAAAAHTLGFKGVALDQELYDHPTTATWDWRFAGDHHSERQVRAKASQRGKQLMQAVLGGFPGAGIVAYFTRLPGSWDAHARIVTGTVQQDPYAASVQVDMWNGMTSVPGYSAIRWFDAWFYKDVGVPGATWDQALQYNARAVYSLLSRRFTNWDYASSRLNLSPFSWIDQGPHLPFDAARAPAYVAEQLAAFRRWGTGGSFGNYAYNALTPRFSYAPYASALRDASKPGSVDSQPPQMTPTGTPQVKGGHASIAGTATDNFAVRVIHWRDDRGDSGTAQLTPDDSTGDPAAVTWKVSGIPVTRRGTRIWLLAQDIKGLSTVASTSAHR
jgi:hypothetical protein